MSERLAVTSEQLILAQTGSPQAIKRSRRFALPSSLLAVFVASALLTACDKENSQPVKTSTVTPPTPAGRNFVPNEPNDQGKFGPSAQAGTCAPFDIPSWISHNQLDFRCVDQSNELFKELRINAKGQPKGTLVSFRVNRYQDQTAAPIDLEYGQTKIVPNPINPDCTIEIANTGLQPTANESCATH